jgi:amino acid adenylation domain-containing protein
MTRMTLEGVVSEAWREVLGVAEVAPGDRFLESGGDSLKAIQLASRLSESLGIAVPLLAVFDHPTPRDLTAALAAAGGRSVTPGPPPAAERDAPLSDPQARLWFLCQLEPGSAVYNAPAAWSLRGRLDVEALRRAVTGLFHRHDALRTGFVELEDGAVVQRAAPESPELELVLPVGEGRDEALRIAVAKASTPVSLAAGEPAGAWLVRAAEREHLLVLGLHHAVCDGPSRALLARDLWRLYEAERGGAPAPPPPRLRYADFAAWQRRQAESHALAGDVDFWRGELAGAPDDLPILPDRPRPPRPSRRGRRRAVAFRPELVSALRRLGAGRDATPFMALLAAFAAVLGRWSGERDLTIGTPVLGRPLPEFADVVGHFASTVPLRVRLDTDPAFGALLDHVRATVLRAFAHHQLPFERLVRELRPERDLSRSPLFQVLFALQPAPPSLEAGGLRMEPLDLDLGTAKFDLMVWLEVGEAGIAGCIEYSTDLFGAETVERIAWQWERLLLAAVEDPSVRIGDVEVLSESDRRGLLAWNATGSRRSEDSVHRRFEAQAGRSPEAPAVVTARGELSYRELDGWADRVAGRLREAGAGPEAVVAVCLSRGPGLIAALLGVLKSGAAYLPLDPAYPPERLRLMLESVQVPIAIAEPAFAERVRGDRRVLLVDPFQPPSRAVAARLDSPVQPGGLAYLISTSGSTGRPKSVAIEHRGVAALVDWALDVYGPEELSGVLASTSVCFDLFAFEIFAPLSAGGTVLLCEHALDFPAQPWRDRVRLVNTVPSAARALLALGPLPASVRTVNLAGEVLPASLVADLYRESGVERVLNLYGPSEDTTYSTWEVVPRGPGAPVIGRPLAAKRAYVLDGGLRPVAPGMSGQIFVAGAGLARGYSGLGALTAASFLADPFRADGSRMYATGDAGRHLPDGRLEFLGRLDAQVKVRGMRVDPGEIESLLLSFPGVREAAAVAVGEDVKRALVGCVVCAPAVLPGLRGRLAERLPGYLVPGTFLAFDRLPRTPSGKVDRRRLAELAAARRAEAAAAGDGDEDVAGDVQRAVAEVWSEVLGVPSVPAQRSFFELGGHSLLASHLVARMRERFGLDLGLAAVFESPTVAAMARVLEERLVADIVGQGR